MNVDGYELLERLNSGREIDVYDAWSEARGCRCVLKTLRPDTPVDKLIVTSPDGTEYPLTREERELRTDFSFGTTKSVGESCRTIRWAVNFVTSRAGPNSGLPRQPTKSSSWWPACQ